jgi:hypothetical protein
MNSDKLDEIINIIRTNLREDAPTMNLGTGKIAGTPEADPGNPPVDLRKKKHRTWNPFFKNLAKVQRRSK